jgi:hypothetical protein
MTAEAATGNTGITGPSPILIHGRRWGAFRMGFREK